MKINLYIKTVSIPSVAIFRTSVLAVIQLFRERLWEKMCTRQSRKVIWDMINTLFLTTSCRSYFCCFPLALANTFSWHFVPIPSNFFEKKRTQNHPQCLSGLSRALFPTTFLEIAVYTSSYRSAEPELLLWRQSFSFGSDVVYQV